MPNPDRTTKFAPGTSVDAAYARIHEAIVSGEFRPGTPLRHQELSDRLEVSLIPIREAIRRLEVERLVESTPNKGARVAPISARDLIDVYDARILIEQQALSQAWSHLTPDVIGELRQLNRQLVDTVKRENPEFYGIHRALHFAIYERADSPWLLHLIEILWSHTERYRRLAARVRPFVDIGRDLHGQVLDAIEAGDRHAASDWLRQDLLRTADLIRDVYIKNVDTTPAATS